MEEWKGIEFIKKGILYDYTDNYEVSNLGNIRNIKTGRILKLGNSSSGYRQVVLSKNGKTHTELVHRIVAYMFIENPNHLPCINHIDEDRLNNNVENLEWCTYEYNNNHGSHNYKIGNKLRNEKNRSKEIVGVNLGTGEVLHFPSAMEVQRVMNISNSNINKCCQWHNNPIEFVKKHKKIHKTVGKDDFGNKYTWYFKEDYERLERNF